jgi:Zn-dependent M28 family amino/carboxypeptidase
VDNAGGVAQLIEIARVMSHPVPRPLRTLLFIATTGEEEGQLGAAYYVSHPSYPLAQTIANINLDFFEPWGRTRDVINYGPTGSTLDDILAAVARQEGRTITPDPTPEEDFWRRGDQYRFALAGVPSSFPAPGIHYVGRPEDYGLTKGKEYTDRDYHEVSDEVRPDWDWSGAAQEVGFLAEVGYRLASDSIPPVWKDSTMCPACRSRGAELVHAR